MTMKTYPRSVQQAISLPRTQPAIIGGFHLKPGDLKKGYTQLLTSLSAEQDVLLAPLENIEVRLPGTWRAMGSMA